MDSLGGVREISYPCVWEYCIIGESFEEIEKIVFEIAPKPYQIRQKNTSAKGRYTSVSLTIEVDSQQQRDEIFSQISSRPEVKVVI